MDEGPWWCWRCRAEKTYPHQWCATPGCDCDECESPAAAELANELVRKFADWEFDRDRRLRDQKALRVMRARLAGYGAMASGRDELVREAIAAGLRKAEVARLTGLARTTIDRIDASA